MLQYPSDVREAAKIVDASLWSALEQLAGQPRIPMSQEGLGTECVLDLVEIPLLQGKSYQRHIVCQPVKLEGLGLRSLEDFRFAAFLGGVEMALPYLGRGVEGEVAIRPQLEVIIEGMEGQERWGNFVNSGCRNSREFRDAWETVSGEAACCWRYIGKESEGCLAATAAVAGGRSMDGSTRTQIVQQLESLCHQVLTSALQAHPDREARPVFVYLNISGDKFAGRWLLAAPTKMSRCQVLCSRRP